ncbi:STAS domain-containing protein [Pseudonocardia sp.]|uniref:STAS domain-containing protein n=1 Tax=Pseudonocardia sp. TaxID=60912 RepID=UPI002D8340F5|nr:STAS domain-containing protein [Pseudonocardia sp.]
MTELDNPRPRTWSWHSPTLRVVVSAHRNGASLRYNVRLVGELDLASVGSLTDALAALRDAQPELVVIDLSELQFVDARGLGALVEADRDLRAGGGSLVLARPDPHVRRVLTLTAVDTQIEVR